MKNRRILIVITALLLLGGFFYVQKRRQAASSKVATSVVKKGPLEQTLTLSGNIDAQQKATLTFQTLGRLAYVGVAEGDTVRKGQLIASLDVRSVKKNLQKELNDFAKERNDLDQARDDYKSIVVTDTIKRLLENAQYDVNNAVLDVELQSIAVQYASLVSPINGIMTRVSPAQPGVNVTSSSAVYEVVNPESIYFSAEIDQTDIRQLSPRMNATVIIDAFPDREIHGVVDTISFAPIDGETGTVYRVKIRLDGTTGETMYRLGMTGDVRFVIKRNSNALYIPLVFVKEDEQGKQFVYVMEKGKKTKKNITTGIETENSIEVTKGLSEGTTIYD